MAHTNSADTNGKVQGVPLLSGIKTKHYTIALPAELAERLAKPPVGEGGWQTLMTDLAAHVDGQSMELPEALLHKMIPRAVKYGGGGYQGVIRWLLCLLLEQHHVSLLGPAETLKAKKGSVQ